MKKYGTIRNAIYWRHFVYDSVPTYASAKMAEISQKFCN